MPPEGHEERRVADGHGEVQEYCRQRRFSRRVVEGGIRYLIEKWEKIANTVAEGKPPADDPTPDYYLACMDVRQILFEVIPFATEAQWESIKERLKRADTAFLEHTASTTDCIWGEANAQRHGWNREQHWWYYRMPRQSSRDRGDR